MKYTLKECERLIGLYDSGKLNFGNMYNEFMEACNAYNGNPMPYISSLYKQLWYLYARIFRLYAFDFSGFKKISCKDRNAFSLIRKMSIPNKDNPYKKYDTLETHEGAYAKIDPLKHTDFVFHEPDYVDFQSISHKKMFKELAIFIYTHDLKHAERTIHLDEGLKDVISENLYNILLLDIPVQLQEMMVSAIFDEFVTRDNYSGYAMDCFDNIDIKSIMESIDEENDEYNPDADPYNEYCEDDVSEFLIIIEDMIGQYAVHPFIEIKSKSIGCLKNANIAFFSTRMKKIWAWLDVHISEMMEKNYTISPYISKDAENPYFTNGIYCSSALLISQNNYITLLDGGLANESPFCLPDMKNLAILYVADILYDYLLRHEYIK